MTFFSHMLNKDIKVYVKSGGLSNVPSNQGYSLLKTIKGRIESTVENKGSSQGLERDQIDSIYLDDEVKDGYKLELPSGDQFQVKKVEKIPHLYGSDTLWKVEF